MGLSKVYQKKPQDSAAHGFTSFILRASQGLPFIHSLMHGMTDQLLGWNQALIHCRLQMDLRRETDLALCSPGPALEQAETERMSKLHSECDKCLSVV